MFEHLFFRGINGVIFGDCSLAKFLRRHTAEASADGESVLCAKLYGAYFAWCMREGVIALTPDKFNDAMYELDASWYKRDFGCDPVFAGIKLVDFPPRSVQP